MDITIRRFSFNDIPALVPLQVAVEEIDRLGLVTTEDDIRTVYAGSSLRPEENSFVAQAFCVTWEKKVCLNQLPLETTLG